MIVPARRRAPRASNYRAGMWPGLGVWDPPAIPAYRDPGYPPDATIVAQNNVMNAQYNAGLQDATVQNNYDVCAANAQNSASQAQYDETMARCGGQAAIQNAPYAGDLPDQAARTVAYQNPVVVPVAAVPWSALPATPAWSGAAPAANVVPSQVNAPAAATTPAGKVVVTSSGASTAPGSTATSAVLVGGFDLSTIPWWGWAAGAAAAFFMFGKGGR